MSTKSVAGKSGSAFASPELIGRAIRDSFAKLNPVALMRNPVIFVTEVVAVLVTVLFVRDLIVGIPFAWANLKMIPVTCVPLGKDIVDTRHLPPGAVPAYSF